MLYLAVCACVSTNVGTAVYLLQTSIIIEINMQTGKVYGEIIYCIVSQKRAHYGLSVHHPKS